jgi:hypothetical protein
MRQVGVAAAIFGVILITGCSNAPLAGTLDCLFPSRARHRTDPPLTRPDDFIRPRDWDPLPPPDLRDLRDSREPRLPIDGGRLEGLPRIGEPLLSEDTPVGRRGGVTNDTRPPLPSFPEARDR